MQPVQFLSDSIDRVRRDGLDGLAETAYSLYNVALARASKLDGTGSTIFGGTNVYDREWDVLLVLDACRPDLLAEVAAEYPFLDVDVDENGLGDVETIRSVASCSEEFLEKTFADERRMDVAGTAYVTGNPFSTRLDADAFGLLDPVWQDRWDDDLGTVRAEPITDRAIQAWRSGEYDRMIVHYMQPHFPSIPNPEFKSAIQPDRIGEHWESVWDQLRNGDLDRDAVWAAYRENLRYVLESVALLLESVDAERVVITADHGNAFGDWGLYGHPRAPIAALRSVPWVEVSARNVSGYEPTAAANTSTDDADAAGDDDRVAAMLRDLGYL